MGSLVCQPRGCVCEGLLLPAGREVPEPTLTPPHAALPGEGPLFAGAPQWGAILIGSHHLVRRHLARAPIVHTNKSHIAFDADEISAPALVAAHKDLAHAASVGSELRRRLCLGLHFLGGLALEREVVHGHDDLLAVFELDARQQPATGILPPLEDLPSAPLAVRHRGVCNHLHLDAQPSLFGLRGPSKHLVPEISLEVLAHVVLEGGEVCGQIPAFLHQLGLDLAGAGDEVDQGLHSARVVADAFELGSDGRLDQLPLLRCEGLEPSRLHAPPRVTLTGCLPAGVQGLAAQGERVRDALLPTHLRTARTAQPDDPALDGVLACVLDRVHEHIAERIHPLAAVLALDRLLDLDGVEDGLDPRGELRAPVGAGAEDLGHEPEELELHCLAAAARRGRRQALAKLREFFDRLADVFRSTLGKDPQQAPFGSTASELKGCSEKPEDGGVRQPVALPCLELRLALFLAREPREANLTRTDEPLGRDEVHHRVLERPPHERQPCLCALAGLEQVPSLAHPARRGEEAEDRAGGGDASSQRAAATLLFDLLDEPGLEPIARLAAALAFAEADLFGDDLRAELLVDRPRGVRRLAAEEAGRTESRCV